MADIGPSLPSSLKEDGKWTDSGEMQSGLSSPPSESTIGPVLPQTFRSRDSDIGPQLPPELALHASDSELDEEEEGISIGPTMSTSSRTLARQESSDEDSYGPRLPSKQTHKTLGDNDYGPMLPSSFKQTSKQDDCDSYGPTLPASLKRESDDDDSFGPSLPPSMSTSTKKTKSIEDDDDDSFGPTLPPASSSKQISENKDDSDDDDDSYGPALPPGHRSQVKGPSLPINPPSYQDGDEEEEEEIVGPMPWMMHKPSDKVVGQSAAEEFEARSRAMKNKLTGKDDDKAPQRDTWMIDLPEYGTNFGLGARQFRKKDLADAGDRSGWTDTPADRARKEKELREGKSKPKKAIEPKQEKVMSKRDQHLLDQVSGHNKTKRADTLMDMHSKKRKAEKLDEASKPQERRPFDRDVDLQVNRFDEAKKKNMMKRAAQLGDRFSHGKDKVFM